MVHNGNEYGITAAHGEEPGVLREVNVGKRIDVETTPLRGPQVPRKGLQVPVLTPLHNDSVRMTTRIFRTNPSRAAVRLSGTWKSPRSEIMTNEHSSPAAETYSFPVVILGGGFAGAYCARAVTAGLRDAATESEALLADQNAMLFHPMLAEVSGSSISPLHVANPLRRFCRGSSIFMGAVEEIDLNGQTVRFSPGPFVHAASLKFDRSPC